MLSLIDIPEELQALHEETRLLTAHLMTTLAPVGERKKIPLNTDLTNCKDIGLCFIHDGFFKSYRNGNATRFFFNGDLVEIGQAPENSTQKIISDFGADITFISDELLVDNLLNDQSLLQLFLQHQRNERQIMDWLTSLYMNRDVKPEVKIQHYKFGEMIIKEGEKPTEIYMLIDGEARVTVKDVEVGSINSGEIFGEISFLTEHARIASVSAKSNCLVQKIAREDFQMMIKYKPQMITSISRTLANRVIQLNDKVVETSKGVQGII
jgi:hypothetical protein